MIKQMKADMKQSITLIDKEELSKMKQLKQLNTSFTNNNASKCLVPDSLENQATDSDESLSPQIIEDSMQNSILVKDSIENSMEPIKKPMFNTDSPFRPNVIYSDKILDKENYSQSDISYSPIRLHKHISRLDKSQISTELEPSQFVIQSSNDSPLYQSQVVYHIPTVNSSQPRQNAENTHDIPNMNSSQPVNITTNTNHMPDINSIRPVQIPKNLQKLPLVQLKELAESLGIKPGTRAFITSALNEIKHRRARNNDNDSSDQESTVDDELWEGIHAFLKERAGIWSKIVRYEPLNIDSLHRAFTSQVKCKKSVFTSFLDAMGIHYIEEESK